ncbi:MAG: hypothetical protein IJE21_07295 [Alistipes sp.]|nr:hypothetical protein [Alistipes sp.]
MTPNNTTPNNQAPTKLQEKRAILVALSQQAKQLRQDKINNAQTTEEAAFWSSRTINYMLLNHIYKSESVRFETFKEWKAQGATIKKGAKATVIWGQPRQGVATLEQRLQKDPHTLPVDDIAVEEYEFFPLCYLFSEDDVYFTNAEQNDTNEEQPTSAPIAPIIDEDTFNEI